MQRKNYWVWLIVLLVVGSGWALVRLFDASTQGGEIYPSYSTLRADPMGAKVLHDSLASLPGFRVERWLEPRRRLRVGKGDVVFVLGTAVPASLLEDCVKWTKAGARVVITAKKEPKGEGLVYAGDPEWLSNEGLHKQRQAQRLLELLEGRRHVIFEESHLGVMQTGSVGMLLRRYRLWGAALVLGVLCALFFWRSTSSLLPAAENSGGAAAPAPGDEALVSLVRAAVPEKELTATAQALWNRGGNALEGISLGRRERVSQVLAAGAGATPLVRWRQAHEILKRQNT